METHIFRQNFNMTSKAIYRFFYFIILLPLFFSSCTSEPTYSITTTLNPNKISPLTALLNIEVEKPSNVSVKVLGESPVEQSFLRNAKSLEIPVVGLYPNRLNKVLVSIEFEGGQIVDTVEIMTNNTPSFFPTIEINKLNRKEMSPGMHACDIHFANNGKFKTTPLIFDDQGQVRWYLDLSFAGKMVSPFQRLKDGSILMVTRHIIFEFDMLGKLLRQTNINPNYGMHHDVLELPDGNLLACVGKRGQFIEVDNKKVQSDSDFIIALDRQNGQILREWDLAKQLDVSRNELNFFRPGDWLHMNGLAFDTRDNSIIVSGKNQGLVKISWKDSLEWIMAPKRKWGNSGRNGKGFDTKPYLLTAVDSSGQSYSQSLQDGSLSLESFDFPWGMHSPEILPNGNLIVFDNGTYRNFENKNHYSRAVEYSIHKEDQTVQQIWQYGRERGIEFFSTIIGDVDYLTKTNNVLITSGYLRNESNISGKIVEVDYQTGEEVFEATLYYKNENGNSAGRNGNMTSWGQTDILYRSERLEMKY